MNENNVALDDDLDEEEHDLGSYDDVGEDDSDDSELEDEEGELVQEAAQGVCALSWWDDGSKGW